MSEHEMIIPATSKGKCGYCGNPNANKVSLTFECYICDEECDNHFYKEYEKDIRLMANDDNEDGF